MPSPLCYIRKGFDYLSNLGINPNLDDWENHKTRLLNQFMIVVTTAIWMMAIYHLFSSSLSFLGLALFYLALNAGLFYLHAQGHLQLTRLLIIGSYASGIFTNIALFGPSLHLEYAIIALIVISILIFQEQWLKSLVVGGLLAGVLTLNYIFSVHMEAVFAHLVRPYDYMIICLVTTTCLIILINSFTKQVLLTQKQNKKLVEDLVQSNTGLKRFNYMISHDLKTPLRSITSFAGLARRRGNKAGLSVEMQDYLAYIEENTIQLNELTDDLLSLAKLDHMSMPEQDFPLQQLFQQVGSRFADMPDIEIEFELVNDGLDIIVNGNLSLLGVVLQNLIENGIKYNNNADKQIQVCGAHKNGDLVLEIRDNGIGIPEDKHKYIFEPFKRLHDKAFPGTGLGLAITRKIVELHNGDIQVTSSTDEGTLFTITLPQIKKSIRPNKLRTTTIVSLFTYAMCIIFSF